MLNSDSGRMGILVVVALAVGLGTSLLMVGPAHADINV